MQFFSSDKGLQEFYIEIIHTPPLELNGRPLIYYTKVFRVSDGHMTGQCLRAFFPPPQI